MTANAMSFADIHQGNTVSNTSVNKTCVPIPASNPNCSNTAQCLGLPPVITPPTMITIAVVAIAKGTPTNPLVEPEDLLDAKIVDMTPLAKRFGIMQDMTGREAVEIMLNNQVS